MPKSNFEIADTRVLWKTLAEIALVFAIFFLHGAWPTPDVNETGYLCKAQHFWNPSEFQNDFFCKSGDAHTIFYWAFGWVTNSGISLDAAAWIGRVLTWLLLAIAWRGLSFSLLPRAWLAILTAELFVMLTEQTHMAGEWIVGGVEAKGFAWALVLWAMQALVRGRWNLALLLVGAATSLHVVVGGWGAIGLGIAWLLCPHDRARFVTIVPGIVGALLLSAPGLFFALRLDSGVDLAVRVESSRIQVFERLPHHLLATAFQTGYVPRHILLWTLFILLCALTPSEASGRRFRRFVAAAMLIASIGFVFSWVASLAPLFAASILRFYWFRMSDVLAPAGVAILAPAFLLSLPATKGRFVRWSFGALLAVSAFDVWTQARHFPFLPPGFTPVVSRADKFMVAADDWRSVCHWAAYSTPPGTIFITPKNSNSSKWYSGRDEVATWKDMPQDARSLLDWYRRLNELYVDHGLRDLAAKHGAQYAIVELPTLQWVDQQSLFADAKPIYQNSSYAVFPLTKTNP